MSRPIYPSTNFTQLEQLNIVRGEGVYVYDDQGKRYLEGLAGLWCAALGYGNAELIEAISKQLHELSYSHLFGGRTHNLVQQLADTLGDMVPIEGAHTFFANSGSEANDSLIKLLHYYYNVTGQPKKKKIIAFDRSYHGVTMASAALTGLPIMHTNFDIPVEALGILRAQSPHYYRGHEDGESEADFVQRLIRDVEAMILREGPETIAAFIAEPIGGAAGVIVAPDDYYPRLQKLLREHGILFWADEVICGFGRTGTPFGSTTVGVQPDLMSLAKQLSSAYFPISAAIVPAEFYEALVQPSAAAGVFGHGYTYTGHPAACAAALKAIEIYRRDRLFEHAAEVGAHLRQGLAKFADHPLVGEVRGKGLIAAVELVANKSTRQAFGDGRVGARCKQFCEDRGLLIRAVAGNSMAFCPPLIISFEQVDEMLTLFGQALADTLDWVTREQLLA